MRSNQHFAKGKSMRFFVVICVFLSLFSCKGKSKGRLKSLENLASGKDVFLNDCDGDPSAPARMSVSALVSKSLALAGNSSGPAFEQMARAVRALPEPVVMFLLQHRASVLIVPDPTAVCAAALPNGGASYNLAPDSVASCVVYIPADGKSRLETLNLVVSSNPGQVSHGLVRLGAAAMSQVVAAVDKSAWYSMRAFEETLAQAFLEDVQISQTFKLDSLKPLIGNDIGGKPQNILDRFDYGGKGDGQSGRKSRFLDFVYSDSFDSYYCNAYGASDPAIINSVASGHTPLKELAKSPNTRARMRILFPRTYKAFEAGNDRIISSIASRARKFEGGFKAKSATASNPSSGGSSGGFNLDSSSEGTGYESPAWAGTSAFFGSIWNNTGGAAANAYKGYQNTVMKAANEHVNAGDDVISGTLKTLGGAAVNSYTDNVYKPIYDKSTDRYAVQKEGGASDSAAFYNTVLLATGDSFGGATKLAEAAGGADTQQGRLLTAQERLAYGAEGAKGALDTITMVAGMTPKSEAINSLQANKSGWFLPGKTAGAVAERNESLLRGVINASEEAGSYTKSELGRLGTVKAETGMNNFQSYSRAMAADAQAAELKAGDTVWRVQIGTKEGAAIDQSTIGNWTSRKPPPSEIFTDKAALKRFVDDTALPYNVNDISEVKLQKYVAKTDVPVIDSSASYAFGKQGGASQTFIAQGREALKDSFDVVSGDAAIAAAKTSVAEYSRAVISNGAGAVIGTTGTINSTINSGESSGDSGELNLTNGVGSLSKPVEFHDDKLDPDFKDNPDLGAFGDMISMTGTASYRDLPVNPGMALIRQGVIRVDAGSEVKLRLRGIPLVITIGENAEFTAGHLAKPDGKFKLSAGRAKFSLAEGHPASKKTAVLIDALGSVFTETDAEFTLVAKPSPAESEIVVSKGTVEYKTKSGLRKMAKASQ